MTRTYLYVDGENFAIRAAHLDGELKKDAARTDSLRQRVNFREYKWQETDAQSHAALWLPEPHRDATYDPRTQNGILYSRDEVYWDSLGLVIAFSAVFPTSRGLNEISIDRAYYFTSASGDRIEQHKRDLHAIGFTPNLFYPVKPDSFTKEQAAKGITVVSRPKPMDILIATQTFEDCVSDNFDRCIFVASDEDYVPLLEAVRRRGKQVWLVAFERLLVKNNRLRFACDRFISYDSVLSVRPLPGASSAVVNEAHR